MKPNESTTAIGRTVKSMKTARSRYDESIRLLQEANILMLNALERVWRVKKTGIGGAADMFMTEWGDVGLQMVAENPTLIAQLEALEPIVLPEAEEELERPENGRDDSSSRDATTYGLSFASARALRDAFSSTATEPPAVFLKKIAPKASSGMQGMLYKLWYMRYNIPIDAKLPNQRARDAADDLLITDDVRWKMIIEACVEAGFIDQTQGKTLAEERPSVV